MPIDSYSGIFKGPFSAMVLLACGIASAGELPSFMATGTLLPDVPIGDDDQFGATIAASGDLCVISAPGDDTVGDNAGCLYVFRFAIDAWVYETKLVDDAWPSGPSLGTILHLEDGVIAAQSGPDVTFFMYVDGDWARVSRFASSCLSNIFADGDWWAIDRGCGDDRELLVLIAGPSGLSVHSSWSAGDSRSPIGFSTTPEASDPCIYIQMAYEYFDGWDPCWDPGSGWPASLVGPRVASVTYDSDMAQWGAPGFYGSAYISWDWESDEACGLPACYGCNWEWTSQWNSGGGIGTSLDPKAMVRRGDGSPIPLGVRGGWLCDTDYVDPWGDPGVPCGPCRFGGSVNCSPWIDATPLAVSHGQFLESQTLFAVVNDEPAPLATLVGLHPPAAIASLAVVGMSDDGHVMWWNLPECNDVDGDNTIGLAELDGVLAHWGTDDDEADINGDGLVNILDLLAVLSGWGPCF